jgi:L-asparaginase II
VAVKIEDGGPRALPSTVMEILRVLGVGTREMAGMRELTIERHVRNCRGDVVGYMRPCFELEKASGAI